MSTPRRALRGGLFGEKSPEERETETMDSAFENVNIPHLEITEGALHEKFRELLSQNRYEEAGKVAELMERLSVI